MGEAQNKPREETPNNSLKLADREETPNNSLKPIA